MHTIKEFQKLFSITNMALVSIPKGSKRQSVKLKINGYDVSATYLNDLKAGTAIALLTDKGNWYLVGEESTAPQQSNKRIIEYRRTSLPKIKKDYANIKILFYTYEQGETRFYIGGDRLRPKLIYSVPRFLSQVRPNFPDISGFNAYISNNGKENDYLVFIDLFDVSRKVIIDSTGAVEVNHPRFLGELGNGYWQSNEGLNDDSYSAGNVTEFTRIRNYGIDNKQLRLNESEFTVGTDDFGNQIFTSIRNTSFLPHDPVSPYERTFSRTAGIGSQRIETIGVAGEFLICAWKNYYITQRANYQVQKVIDGSVTVETYTDNSSYYLYTPSETKQLIFDIFVVASVIVISETSTEITVGNVLPNSSYTSTEIARIESEFNKYVGHPVLHSYFNFPANKFWLIKGSIVDVTITQQSSSYIFAFRIAVEERSLLDYVSFFGRIISNNGSWFAYFYSQRFTAFDAGYASTDNIYNLFVTPLAYLSTSLAYPIYPIYANLFGDNMVKNKIYRTVSFSDFIATGKALVEEWVVGDDGSIRYSGVLRRGKTYPLKGNFGRVLSMSCQSI